MKQTNLIMGLCVLLSLLTGFSVKSQDVIIKTDKKEIKAKILEIDENTVKYKKFEFLDGPSYNINKSEVFMIIYKNGTRETFEIKPAEVKPAPAPLPIEIPKYTAPKTVIEKGAATVGNATALNDRVMYFPSRLWGSLPGEGSVFISGESEYGLLPNYINSGIGVSASIFESEYASSFGYGISIYASAFLPINRLTGNLENQNKGFFPFVRLGPSYTSTDIEIDGASTSSSSFDISYGVGVDYKFSKKFGVSIIFSQFKSFGAGLNFSFK